MSNENKTGVDGSAATHDSKAIEWANCLKLFLADVISHYKATNGDRPRRLLPIEKQFDCVEIVCTTHDGRTTRLTVSKIQIVDAVDSFAADCANRLSQ